MGAADELSTTMPLVPPVADAVAEVFDVVVKKLSVSKAMIQPDAAGHLICASPVMALAGTLRKILSLFVPVLLNSVIGEQATFAVVSEGPRAGEVGSITPLLIAMTHSAVTVVVPVK